ncbi:MAG TPA: FtsX-like permease family protein [Candidatus Binatia bacterium]
MSPLRDTFRIPFCFLRSDYTRLLLTIGALAAGVALVCAIQLINSSVLHAFEDVIDTMAGRAALQVSAGDGGFFPEDVADAVGGVPGVELAVQTVGATALVADGSGEILTVHGVEITNDAAVRVYQAQGPENTQLADPLVFLNQPDSVMLTRDFARRRALHVGDGIELETPAGRKRFTVRGLLEPKGIARVHGGNLAVMDLFAAEESFTRPGLINRIDVVVHRDVDLALVREHVASVLPPGLTVEPPAQRKADLQRIMQSMQLVLQVIALLALGAGFLIAFNRIATVFERRTWQHGVMRAIGARRWAVQWELLKEGVVLGLCGSALGVPVGVGLAYLLLPVIANTTALSSRVVAPSADMALGWSPLVVASALGLLTAVLAALGPARRAAGTEIADIVRHRTAVTTATRGRGIRLACGAVFIATMIAMAIANGGGAPTWGLAATCGVLIGSALAARPLLDVASKSLTLLAKRYASSGFFALAALARNPGRTALTISTLAVGFGTVIWIWIVAQSFERSVVNVVHGVLHGDLAVGSAHSTNGIVPDPIDESALEDLRSIPGITAVVGEQAMDWHYAGGPIVLNAFDGSYWTSGAFGEWPLLGKPLPDLAEGLADGRYAIISTSFVLHLGKHVGDVITLDTPTGPFPLTVGGVVSTLLSPRGTVILGREVYKRAWNDPHVIHGLVRVSDARVDAVRARIAAALGQHYNVTILSLKEVADWTGVQVQQAFAGLYVLAGVILFLVLLGAADTLAAGVLEQRRELAVVRAAGVRARQLQRVIFLEALLLGVFGLLLAFVAGLVLGIFWVWTVLPNLLGWVLELHIPWFHFLAIASMSLIVCLLAALIPSLRARHLAPALALRYE